jgi:lantibiotic modifying enzyme
VIGVDPWAPLAGAARDATIDLSRTLADRFRGFRPEREDVSLATGWAGVALFHAYRGAALEDDDALAEAGRTLERALDSVDALAGDPSLFTGLAGVAWVVSHLDGWLLDLDDDEAGDHVDREIERLVSSSSWGSHVDLVSGLAGLAVYAEERLPRPAARRILAAIGDRLCETADPRTDGRAWHTPPEWISLDAIRERYPQGYRNLGVAHGAAGVVAALARIHATDPSDASRDAFERSWSWLFEQRLPPGFPTAFPNYVADGVVPEPSRAAWCYGDPGIATVLASAATLVGDDHLRGQALAVARAAAARPTDVGGVIDASVCHGAAGLAHLFSRLHHATGEGLFADAARAWLERVPAYIDDLATPWFLEGAAGVGLVVLASATDLEPSWDRVLLASSRPPFGGPA